jgi:hypothetical protein
LSGQGLAFFGEDGSSEPEEGVIDVLLDIVAQLQSGTKLLDLHGDPLRSWTGQEVGVIAVMEAEEAVE